MKIGCDIGGVVKRATDDDPVPDAVESVLRLVGSGKHTLVFISKCGPAYAARTSEWLARHGLEHLPIEFCADYAGKVDLARKHQIECMIDDKMTVLKHFPADEFTRVWFCTEQKNIAGARKHDPEFFHSVHLVQSWREIEDLAL